MMPVIPSCVNNIVLIPGTPFTTRTNECLRRCTLSKNSTKQKLSSQEYAVPLSSVRFVPHFRSGFALHHKSRIHVISGNGTQLAVDESDPPVEDKVTGGASSDAIGTSKESSAKPDANVSPAQSKYSRSARRSEMPMVKPEELIPGAIFTGKVRSIQQFGAFVDFGAFTDGLVHVSKLSDTFVKNVGDVVSVGQVVKVRVVEADLKTRRISLTMRDRADVSNLQQRKDDSPRSDKRRPPGKSTSRSTAVKKTNFIVGQDLVGTVKNSSRSGALISLPEGEEGFLPRSEEQDGGVRNIMGNTSLQVGQEISVRVLRIRRGQLTLTMKTEAGQELDSKLIQGSVHTATNPFLLAFHKNKDVAEYLNEREKVAEPAERAGISKKSDEMEGKVNQTATKLDEMQDQQPSNSERLVSALSAVKLVEDDETSSKEVTLEATKVHDASNEEEVGVRSEILAPEERGSASNRITEEASAVDMAETDGKGDLIGQTVDRISSENLVSKEVNGSPEHIVSESLQSLNSFARSIEEEVEIGTEILSSEDSVANAEGVNTLSALSAVVKLVEDDETSSKEVKVEATKVHDASNEEEAGVRSEIMAPEEHVFASDLITEEASVDDMAETDREGHLLGQTVDRISSENLVSKEVIESPENIGSESLQCLNSIGGSIEEKVEISTEILSSEDGVSDAEEVNSVDGLQNERKTILSAQIAGPTLSGNAISKEITDNQADSYTTAKDLLRIPTPGNEVFSSKIMEDKEVGIQPDKNGSITSSIGQIDVPTLQQSTTEENVNVADSNTQSEAPSLVESTIKAAISPALVKQLREETGAGMMDCKKALSETGGDLVQAQEFLRKKGLASADKKASRATAEGRIGSYVHDSRIGVLIEVNCETDFVSRGEIFKELVDDLAMQVAACPQVQYLMTEDVPQEIVEKERVIEMQKEDLLSKPEQIRAKIVEGRIRKRLEELALLEQPYIKNDKLVVKDWVKQTIATIGENMKVKRFVRYNLGEGLEKKSQDFAAEVAAQTAAKSAPSLGKDQPAVIEIKETVDEPLKATVSAALVKQLREETGAGMMDCKKALSETEGDPEKAQEYLRKKGLSTADKKSSRLAGEGRIGSYIHDTRIGVLIEVNCETDFVGRSERFKELADDLAMQVVACPQVQYVSIQDIPESIISKEKALEMQREDLLSKPENIRERIVEGRIAKRLGELALIEQPFIKDDSILVKDLVKQTVATLGENIKVRRFVRFTLGETNKSEKTE